MNQNLADFLFQIWVFQTKKCAMETISLYLKTNKDYKSVVP